MNLEEHYSKEYFEKQIKWYENKNLFCTFRLKNVFYLSKPKKNEKVLDLGCGVGTFSLEAARLGANVVGIDTSPVAIKVAKLAAKRHHLQKNIKYRLGKITKLSFKSNSFDKVYWAGIIEHISKKDYFLLLKETVRVLKKHGQLILESPTNSHFLERLHDLNIILKKDITHIDYKDLDFVSYTLKKDGFEIRVEKYLPTHMPILNIFESVLMKFPLIGKYFKRRFVVLAVKT